VESEALSLRRIRFLFKESFFEVARCVKGCDEDCDLDRDDVAEGLLGGRKSGGRA
jgi:hypothetical protein